MAPFVHAVTWWEAFTQVGHVVAMTDIHRAIGMGSDQMLDHLLPPIGTGTPTRMCARRTVPCTPRTGPGCGHCRVQPTCCGHAARRGLTVVLASSADEPEFNALRAALDAEDAIDAATFSGDVESSKPAPDLVEVALEKVGMPAGEAVFIGDTVWDVQACQKARVPCIGLLSGGISRDELTAAGAVEV